MEYVITALVIVACIILVVVKKQKPTEDKLEKQKREYEEILTINNVPKEHYKIVVGQSKVYNIYNCPAIVWKEENMVKTLYLRDSHIDAISATKKGREYLEECYALSQTKADRVALKKKFGGN